VGPPPHVDPHSHMPRGRTGPVRVFPTEYLRFTNLIFSGRVAPRLMGGTWGGLTRKLFYCNYEVA
jgi:hypothetical protein